MSTALTLPKFARSKSTVNSELRPPDTKEVAELIIGNIEHEAKRTPAIGIVGGIVPRTPAVGIAGGIVPKTPAGLPIGLGPRSPLYIPKIGVAKGMPATPRTLLQPGENPWLPPKVEGDTDIKITAITPIGTIAMVPTCDKRPPPTPRRPPPTPTRHLTLRVIDKTTGNTYIDPILTTTIYLDCTKPEDQDYNHVAQRMRTIANTIATNNMTLEKQYFTVLRPLINVSGRVTAAVFEEALSIYENNQVYYQDRIDDKTLTMDAIKTELTALEHWFAHIIEPKAIDDVEAWRERELIKITKGHTAYCDPELYQYIQPLSDTIRAIIQRLQG